MSVHKGKRGSGGRVAITLHSQLQYDQSAVSNSAFYMELFKQFRMFSLGRVLWDLACN